MENITYYVGLYLFVLLIRYFKLKKQLSTEDYKKKWFEVFDISLDIVYTASGFIIALLINVEKNWIPAVIVIYLILVVGAAFLEMTGDKFEAKKKTILHSIITIIIVFMTFISFKYFLPSIDVNGNKQVVVVQECKPKKFKLCIPYQDLTLLNHIGYNKMFDKYLFYETTTSSMTADSAIENGIRQMINDTLLKPIIVNAKDRSQNKDFLKIEKEKIIIKELINHE